MSKLAKLDDNIARGGRLAAAREAQRLSQTDFADRLGISPRAYQNYERGEREMPTTVLTALHAEFGIDPLLILIGSDAKAVASAKADILEEVIIGVETHLQRTHKKLSVAKKARLIKVLYLQFREKAKVDAAQLADTVSLIG